MATILVVDDVRFQRELLARLVRSLGYDTVLADDGASAVSSFAGVRPAAVLLDINLPGGMDGVEACSQMLSIDSQARVVMVTATADQGTVRACLRAGARECLVKPVPADRLEQALRKLCP